MNHFICGCSRCHLEYLPSSKRFLSLFSSLRVVGFRFQFGQHDHTLVFNSCLYLRWVPDPSSESKSFLHTHWVTHTVPIQGWTWDHGCISISGAMRYILFLTMNNLLTSLSFSIPSQPYLQQAELNCILLPAAKSPNLFNYNKNIPFLGCIIKTSLRISMVTAMDSALGNTVF